MKFFFFRRWMHSLREGKWWADWIYIVMDRRFGKWYLIRFNFKIARRCVSESFLVWLVDHPWHSMLHQAYYKEVIVLRPKFEFEHNLWKRKIPTKIASKQPKNAISNYTNLIRTKNDLIALIWNNRSLCFSYIGLIDDPARKQRETFARHIC